MSGLAKLNQLSEAELDEGFRRACGAEAWVKGMVAARPFDSIEQLLDQADDIWWGLSEADWREAFLHHPKIGDINSLRAKYGQNTEKWASNEQAGVSEADEAVIHGLAAGNEGYEARFGYIFIVCATGKTAAEMLALLNSRLDNEPEEEIRIAAEQQRQITAIRLKKLLGDLA